MTKLQHFLYATRATKNDRIELLSNKPEYSVLTLKAAATILRPMALFGRFTPRIFRALLARVMDRTCLFVITLTPLLASLLANQFCSPARATTFEELYSFYQTPPNNPAGGLVLGIDGNYYGTTFGGGQYRLRHGFQSHSGRRINHSGILFRKSRCGWILGRASTRDHGPGQCG